MGRGVIAVVVLTEASLALAACTSDNSPHAGQPAPTPRGTRSATPASGSQPSLSDVEARTIVAAVDGKARDAIGRRSIAATKRAEAGSLLALSLGQFTYAQHRHTRPKMPSALSIDTVQVPPAGSAETDWFEASAWNSVGEEFASLYERSGGAWHKTMQVHLTYGHFPKWDVTDSVATPATADQKAQAQRAIHGLARYLATGRRPRPLIASLSAQSLRHHIKVNTAPRSWRTADGQCVSQPPKAVIQSQYGVSYLADIYCRITWSAKPGFTAYLTGSWKDLPTKSHGLVRMDDLIVVEVAATTLPNGKISLVGMDWDDVAMNVQ